MQKVDTEAERSICDRCNDRMKRQVPGALVEVFVDLYATVKTLNIRSADVYMRASTTSFDLGPRSIGSKSVGFMRNYLAGNVYQL